MGRFGQNPQASVFVDGLQKELETVTDPLRRVSILYAIYRVLEREPGRRDDVFFHLDEALLLAPELGDLAYESWRTAHARHPEKRVQALTDLVRVLTDPKDVVYCRVVCAHLLALSLNSVEEAASELDAADQLLRDQREVVWTRAFIRKENNSDVIATALKKSSMLTQDFAYKAALLLEAAALQLSTGANGDEVAVLLSRALSLPALDWSLLDSAYRIALALSKPELAAYALQKLAENEMAPLPASLDDTRPLGHDFRGFTRQRGRAAAYRWLYSVLQTKYVKNREAAHDALAEARRILSKNRWLRLEQALLQEAMGASREAFETACHVDFPKGIRGLMALRAGAMEEAFRIGAAMRELSGGLFGEAIVTASSDAPDPPSRDVSDVVHLDWFETHPDHPKAPEVARRLVEHGVETPFLLLFKEEQLSQDQPLLAIAEGRGEVSWVHALNAFLGPPEIKAESFLKLSGSTDDPILKALFIRVGAAFKQAVGGPETDIEYLLKNARAFALAKEHPEVRFEPTKAGWTKALKLLSEEREASMDATDIRTALYKTAFIHQFGLFNSAAASGALTTLLENAPADITAMLFDMDARAKRLDWQIVTTRLETLSRTVTADAGRFDLLLGELHLMATKLYQKALAFFDRAGRSDSPDIVDASAIYRLITLHQMGERQAIRDAIESTPPPPPTRPQAADDFFSRLFDDPLNPRNIQAMKLLEGYGKDTPQKWIAHMVFSLKDGPPSLSEMAGIAKNLRRLSTVAGSDGAVDGFHATASLLVNRSFDPNIHAGAIDDEYLWYANTHISDRDELDPDERVIALRTEGSAPRDDLEWIEWMLVRAETEADKGDFDAALRILHQALEVNPEHPGLLETQSLFAYQAGRFAEAADTHGRLAGFYDSPEEMIHHLAQAALILYDKLNNPSGALNICREALKRSPEHAEMNDIITYIVESHTDMAEQENSADSDNETTPQPKEETP